MTAQVNEIHGYYRYTDIWFEWFNAFDNPKWGEAVKAVFAHDSLVHPDSPLHKEGIDGIEMFMGTLANGEKRLLFSSAQVEYVRYWLYTMQITDQLIPIPHSECLLTDAHLRLVSPVIFKTGGDLKLASKEIQKTNKRLKNLAPEINNRRDMFERVRTFWANGKGTWLALDFEAWDRDHKVITEIGWRSLRYGDDNADIDECGHIIIKEHRYYNSTYVPQYREKYNFGKSEIVSKKDLKRQIHDLIMSNTAYGPLFLVFHDHTQDVKYLKSTGIEAPIDELKYFLPDSTPDDGMYCVDTAELFAGLEGDGYGNKRSLERVCRLLGITTTFLHNAGNDAFYTLDALREMASGDPVDMQREKRWPNHIPESKGVKVQFNPWEEDSDWDGEPAVHNLTNPHTEYHEANPTVSDHQPEMDMED